MFLENNQVIASHGLGNQLSQFAFAHYLTLKLGKPVCFENSPIISNLGNGTSTTFQLKDMKNYCSHLEFKTNFVISNHSIFGKMLFRMGIANSLSAYLLRENRYKIVNEHRENQFKYSTQEYSRHQSSFRGFWFHYKYVYDNHKILHEDLSNFLKDKSKMTVSNLNSSSSPKKINNILAIHVRRGDFGKRGNEKTFGLISENSYIKIITAIVKENPDIKVITFTNDENKLKNFKYTEFFGDIYGNELDPLTSLYLMSTSNYLIAANSSLSWWGAFLGLYNGARVFLPSKFYNGIETNEALRYPGFNYYTNSFE